MEKRKVFDDLLVRIDQKAREIDDMDEFYGEVVKILADNVPYYNWTGFYFMKDGELVIGPYIGRPTEHVKIKVGQGVCGRAVAEKNTIIVDDVTKEDNYLACSLETKSEIVVPIWVNGDIIGEIDIDSDDLAAFDEEDKRFLEKVAEIISRKLKK
ncbi:putative GAF sensor protein [Thermoanaerobacter ethanolicus JW 200]|uniref:GAF domain-containing protein n=1 Tax=Thermoanaerobacter siderophilus SR4 TaxID=880478 RepID=I8R4Y9_9THEO|nr:MULTISPECIES: GAF domain-containing protein [Thermoanaerobacter]EGD51825.1 putative GAF sensor protein [Thermoanaerobacter ethanolicus JW 200]EIW00470.1 GAF domain-containing protein [Thermoanaerobacter siderophilus SR4]UZQ82137.1 GAF domain-containing protein [Thermoanaerobacter sp. RKWS2]HHY80622.1 GAF domain-containing protein [Thermoanaerobacter sp.]